MKHNKTQQLKKTKKSAKPVEKKNYELYSDHFT